MDAEMDHGPIVAIKSVPFTDENWPPRVDEFKSVMATEATKILLEILPQWFAGTAKTTEQDHSKATFTKKIMKADGEINLNGDPWKNYLKIQAFSGWPRTFFFVEKQLDPKKETGENMPPKKIRVTIQTASFDRENMLLKIERVIPEGGKEMSYDDFLRGL
jgi:methionyl-tRNA formyltransferase